MRSLIVLLLVGCVHTSIIEVPEPLPVPQKQTKVVLPQKHYITQNELAIEVQKIRDHYLKFSQDLGNLEWWYLSQFFDDVRTLTRNILEKLNAATNEEDMLFYRQLYYDTVAVFNEAAGWWQDKRTQMYILTNKFEAGPQ